MTRWPATISAIFLSLVCTVAVWAQTPPPIHFTASVQPSPVRAGEVATVTINATVDPDWHVYSTVPSADGFGPSATEIQSFGTWKAIGPTGEDAPVRAHDPNFNMDIGTHEHSAVFMRSFRVPKTFTASSALPTTVTLHYQTCNQRICLPPKDVDIPVTILFAAGSVRSEYAKPPTVLPKAAIPAAPVVAAAPPIAVEAPTAVTPITPSHSTDTGLGLFLLAAILAGLVAILTPCVFPLIPITLTNFVKQADGDQGKLVRLSLGYALGIVLLYVALGAVVTATFGAAGINKLSANPWVNLGIFVVFVVFALSFFETITLQLPGNLSALQSSARKHSGLLGLILLGVTFVLASFTCTAPFIGTLLVTAAGGEKFRPLLGTLVFAIAFTSPFLIFAAFPQWISRIPKSGIWLARAKGVLGFLELAAALKFLSNADQVWNWRFLTTPVLLAAWAAIAVCAGLYLLGTLRFGLVAETETPEQRKNVSMSRRGFAVAFFAFAAYCVWGVTGRPISPYLGAFLPASGYGGVMAASADKELTWQSHYETALDQARSEGKLLFIDFTGVTCTNCRLNEKKVFPRPEIRDELSQFVRVQLYTDSGPDGAKNQKLQESKFGDVALPLYAVIDPKTGTVVDKIAGVLSPDDFQQFLSRARTATTSAQKN